jgi:hypothetical protein
MRNRFLACALWGLGTLAFNLFSFVSLLPMASAETWSDASGKFKLEAEYAGIDGKSVVLRKPNGKTINVPIANLSPESRAQAKALYQKSKTTGTTSLKPTTVPASSSGAATYAPKKRELKFTAPALPPISPLPAFPENASLQESLDFVRTHALAGHLEVFWFAMPEDLRQSADSSELREGLRPVMNANLQTTNDAVAMIDKLLEVLVTKKAFILKSPILSQTPPEVLPLIEAGYEPVTGLIYEYTEMASNPEALVNTPLTSYLTYHLPRIGAHAQSLVKLVPAPLLAVYLDGITATQASETSGTISYPKQDGTAESVEMVRYNSRWIPKDLADQWQEKKATFVQDTIAYAAANQDLSKSNPQIQAMGEGVVKQANAVLDPLLAAKTQQEFDFALGQVMMPLMMAFGSGAGPGAGPGAGAPFGAEGLGAPQ